MSATDNKKLILAVEKHPALWDTACSDYKDRLQKANAWKSICEEVVENYSEIEDDRARNDVGKQLQVQFLLKTLDAAETTSNIPGCHVDNQGDLEVQPSPKIERRSKKPKSVDMQIIDYLNKQDESASDDIELFFRSLHSSVKDFTEDEKLELKVRVISVISDIRKSRSNYPHNNVSQISGAVTYYPYNVANTTAPQVPLIQGPPVGQVQQMPSLSYTQLEPRQCSHNSNPPSVSSVSSDSSVIDILNFN